LQGGIVDNSAEHDALLPRSAAVIEPSEGELERAIVDAVRAGLGDVARVLAAQLESRQRALSPNVVALADRRRRDPR